LNGDLFWITTGGRDLEFVFASLSSARAQSNLRTFQICRGKPVSKQDFFGRIYLVKLYGSFELIAIGLLSVNPRFGFFCFFLQRCRVIY